MKSEKRTYTQTKRADATAATRQRIMQSLVELWLTHDLDAITLQAVATAAQTTVQSIIRHFGSKDALIDAVIEERSSGIEAGRDVRRASDLDAALADLCAHYEKDGHAVLRTLSIAHSSAAAKKVVAHGRRVHREWCQECLDRFATGGSEPALPITLDALVAATDIQVWALLRRDLGRSPEDTFRTIKRLAQGVLAHSDEGSPNQ